MRRVELTVMSSSAANYIFKHGSEMQRSRWLPKMISGDVVTAIAMTEPGAGSDLQGVKTSARRDGEYYVVNGSTSPRLRSGARRAHQKTRMVHSGAVLERPQVGSR
jgi:alkylation response protein AidB-like acyl-CoA dehydrogenase